MSDLHKDAASEKPPARHSTGPRTKAGRAVSSRNSRTHGCCSKQLVIQGESQEEFDELLQDWMEDYRPRGKSTRMLVQDAAEAQWVLNRNRNRYNDLEASLQEMSALEWTEEEHKEMQRCLRYRTTAERSFTRALNTLEQVAKRRRRQAEERDQAADEEQEKREDAEEQVAEVTNVFKREITDIEIGAIHVLDQWVDVEIKNEKTVTKLDPSNEQLLEDRKIMKPPPEQVRRRFDFRHGIPDEYSWCLQTEEQRTMRQWAVQQITLETWLEAIEREKAFGYRASERYGRGSAGSEAADLVLLQGVCTSFGNSVGAEAGVGAGQAGAEVGTESARALSPAYLCLWLISEKD